LGEEGGREWVVVYKERATRVNLLTESSDPFTTNVFCFHLFEYNLPTSRININRQTKKKGKITHFNEIDIALGFFDRHVKPPYPHPTPQAKRDFFKIKTFFKRENF
jgi:hypothetical protein